MPDHIGHTEFNLGASTIKKYFQELVLDENNLCLECKKMLDSIKMTNVKLSYLDFISNINEGRIKSIRFAVKNYGHYNNCVIEYQPDALFKIQVRLSNDKKEWYGFLEKFDEKKNIFKIVPKGRLTLEQIWDDVEIFESIWNT